MIGAFANCFKIPELKKKILFTLAIIAAYRVGCYIPTPGVNGAVLGEYFQKMTSSASGSIFGVMNMFSGGALEKATVFALGIMPYISSSIIMQLLTAVIPALEKLILKKQDSAGPTIQRQDRQRIMQLAVARSLHEDKSGIKSMRTQYRSRMDGTPDLAAFGLITEQTDATASAFRERATVIAKVSQLESFMTGYREKLENGDFWATYD